MGRVPALVAIDQHGRVRAWSRPSTSLGDRVGSLLEPFVEAPRGTVIDGELVALSSQDGRTVQDFTAVCRAALQADAMAASKLHLIAFDLLELAGADVRSLPWVKRTELLREAFPVSERLRLVQALPASRPIHDQLVELGFEGSVLKQPGSTYRPGRQSTWRKYKASHHATATLRGIRLGRDGHTYAISDLDGRRVTTLGSPQLGALSVTRSSSPTPASMPTARCARSGSTRSTPRTPWHRAQSSRRGWDTRRSPPAAPRTLTGVEPETHLYVSGLTRNPGRRGR